ARSKCRCRNAGPFGAAIERLAGLFVVAFLCVSERLRLWRQCCGRPLPSLLNRAEQRLAVTSRRVARQRRNAGELRLRCRLPPRQRHQGIVRQRPFAWSVRPHGLLFPPLCQCSKYLLLGWTELVPGTDSPPGIRRRAWLLDAGYQSG